MLTDTDKTWQSSQSYKSDKKGGGMTTHSNCCVSLVSTRKEARWSIRFFSLFTVHHKGYVQQTNKQNWTLNSNEDQEHCVATLYIYEPKNVREKETTRTFLNS